MLLVRPSSPENVAPLFVLFEGLNWPHRPIPFLQQMNIPISLTAHDVKLSFFLPESQR